MNNNQLQIDLGIANFAGMDNTTSESRLTKKKRKLQKRCDELLSEKVNVKGHVVQKYSWDYIYAKLEDEFFWSESTIKRYLNEPV